MAPLIQSAELNTRPGRDLEIVFPSAADVMKGRRGIEFQFLPQSTDPTLHGNIHRLTGARSYGGRVESSKARDPPAFGRFFSITSGAIALAGTDRAGVGSAHHQSRD